ncbi:uncharacterized protein TNCV_2508851 [Trichonephila clavipes]|nr:uncharacterized protein TNCV_2508851 [Trichonephila clavipes]
MARRNHLDDFTRGRMIGKLEEGRTVTSVTAELGINECVSFRALGKRSKSRVQLLQRLVVAACGGQLQGMTDISSCRRKEADGSQQVSLLSNSLQQRGDKCRGLLWPGAFTNRAYSPAVLNAASRLKLTTDATVYSGAESIKSGQLSMESCPLYA